MDLSLRGCDSIPHAILNPGKTKEMLDGKAEILEGFQRHSAKESQDYTGSDITDRETHYQELDRTFMLFPICSHSIGCPPVTGLNLRHWLSLIKPSVAMVPHICESVFLSLLCHDKLHSSE